MTDKKKILAKLFFSTLYLSAFTFGGGYVIVTLMKQKFVDELHWIQEDWISLPLLSPPPEPSPSTGRSWWASSWRVSSALLPPLLRPSSRRFSLLR